MSPTNFRHSVRAIILDERDRVLLCRFAAPDANVWVAPGGGVEPGETPLAALRRELREEIGLDLTTDPFHVWHQAVARPANAAGHDGVVNDYYLVRTTVFTPHGDPAELAVENITETRWWTPRAIAAYHGPDLFSPRDLATPLAALIANGAPTAPLRLGV